MRNSRTSTIQRLISQIANRVKSRYKPKKIVLFGSYAYGVPRKDSDIDLLIIKNTTKTSIERWIKVRKILRDFNRLIPISPLVYTEKELEERLKIKDFFIKEILEKGKVLYE
jgi:predicted nucleotidyltransferase